jgi:PAS domain S-box-containing protein
MHSKFLEKLMDSLDRIDPGSLQTQFLRLAGEKGLLETIFHAMQEGLIVLDGKACISYANRSAQEMIGFQMPDAEGQPLQKFIRDLDWEDVIDFEHSDWPRLVSRDLEITYPEHRFVEFYLVPLSAEEDIPKGAVVIFRDVTRERKTLSSTLETERLNAVMLLAAGVAHEIGNPLNSLNIHLQLLDRDLHEDPEEIDFKDLHELVRISRNEVSRLDQIITQFLKALRPNAADMGPVDMGQVLEESVKFLKIETEDKGALVEVEIPDEVPIVSADPTQIKQVFYNVIRNAVQAMGSGGLLRITLSVTDRFVAIAFKDTGVGMDADTLSRIFEPYHTTKPEGSGLGLMIVHRIMRDHGAQIEVESQPEKGTTFTLFFPREDSRIRLLEGPSESNKEST